VIHIHIIHLYPCTHMEVHTKKFTHILYMHNITEMWAKDEA